MTLDSFRGEYWLRSDSAIHILLVGPHLFSVYTLSVRNAADTKDIFFSASLSVLIPNVIPSLITPEDGTLHVLTDIWVPANSSLHTMPGSINRAYEYFL
jgi:hypothetical protein